MSSDQAIRDVCVTGSSGYVGTNLVGRLRDAGYVVLGIDRVGNEKSRPDRFLESDLLDADRYSTAIGDADLVCHLAAAKGDWGISDEEYFRDNVEATQALLREGKRHGVRRWIFFSTVSALGPSKVPLDETAEPRPVIPYGTTKLECEKLFRTYAAEDPAAEIIIVRPSVVFGPHNPWNTNIYRLIDSIHRNRFVMVGDGQVHKTTSYITNLVDATMFLVDKLRPGVQVFHYVDDPVWNTEQLVDRIYRALGKKVPRLRLPLWLARSIARINDVAGDVLGLDFPITSARIEKFCTDTNFLSRKIRDEGFEQRVEMPAALDETVAWHLDEVAQRK